VFAGRNWNAGETIGQSFITSAFMPYAAGNSAEHPIQMTIPALAELVLRRADGSFLPASYLLSTFCHEVCCSSCSRVEVFL